MRRFFLFLMGSAIGLAFGLHLWSLYSQLIQAFKREEQFTPTRIYSDVTRIAIPQDRALLEKKLKDLGYRTESTNETLQFNLHSADYPTFLIPANHPQIQKKEAKILLRFQDVSKTSLLQAIEIEGAPIPDLYLEPELVATLARAGGTRKEIRNYLRFDEIPSAVWKAIISIEDQHFLDHKGLDPRGIARAIWVNLKTRSFAQGGSTITQQLVKNLMVRRTKNIFSKINELFLTIFLEAKFEKEEILERYLNEVYLGQVGSLEVHGVSEGAQHFFGKNLDELNLAEITLMAGLIRGPAYYSPYRYKARALERQRLVLQKMVETGHLSQSEAENVPSMPIRLVPPQTVLSKAPFFTDYVKAELLRLLKGAYTEDEIIQSGFRVYTTLDASLNLFAQKTVSTRVNQLEKRFNLLSDDRLEGALASVEQATGYVRVLVGGKNYSQSGFNRILNMKRQVGSAFKPMVYLTAFKKGEDPQGIPYGSGYVMEDAPWTLTYDKQVWTPKNYDPGFEGLVTLRKALSRSINVVAAKLGNEVGIDKVIETAQALGIESPLPRVPSLSLGVAELSPVELLKAYATLANHGVQTQLTVIRGIITRDNALLTRVEPSSKPEFEAAQVDLLTDILQSVFNEGTAREARRMGFHSVAAGKTGTTSNYRDAWFAGYTPKLTTVVWVGLDHAPKGPANRLKLTLTGANSALPIWVDFMKEAEQGEPTSDFQKSPLLKELKIDQFSGKVATSDCPPAQVVLEKYIEGHEPKEEGCAPAPPPPR